MLTGIKHSVPHNYCKFDFNLSKSLIFRSEKKKTNSTSPAIMRRLASGV